MNKRIRKKLRRGEFAEYGFEIVVFFAEAVTKENYENTLDNLIEAVESIDMYIGGTLSYDRFVGFVTRAPRKSCSEEDRTLITEKFLTLSNVSFVETGPLQDIWN